jgi:hypothetical protein
LQNANKRRGISEGHDREQKIRRRRV